ncbi:MAG: DUF192 domain-containing protein [Pseudomonadota bacterium]
MLQVETPTLSTAILLTLFSAALLCPPTVVGAEPAAGTGPSSFGPNRLPPHLRKVSITMGHKVITGVVADTLTSRIEGLLKWTGMDDDTGMLLDFGADRAYSIHMQGMKFPIDAVWMDAELKVRVIYESIQPNSGITYSSMFPSRYCLELNAGFCRRFGVRVDQQIRVGHR